MLRDKRNPVPRWWAVIRNAVVATALIVLTGWMVDGTSTRERIGMLAVVCWAGSWLSDAIQGLAARWLTRKVREQEERLDAWLRSTPPADFSQVFGEIEHDPEHARPIRFYAEGGEVRPFNKPGPY